MTVILVRISASGSELPLWEWGNHKKLIPALQWARLIQLGGNQKSHHVLVAGLFCCTSANSKALTKCLHSKHWKKKKSTGFVCDTCTKFSFTIQTEKFLTDKEQGLNKHSRAEKAEPDSEGRILFVLVRILSGRWNPPSWEGLRHSGERIQGRDPWF